MKEAKDAALKLIKDKILPKLVEEANWSPKEYRDFMLRIPKDFTGSQLDNSDDYAGYTKNADPVVQRVMKFAWGHMPHQDKCQVLHPALFPAPFPCAQHCVKCPALRPALCPA